MNESLDSFYDPFTSHTSRSLGGGNQPYANRCNQRNQWEQYHGQQGQQRNQWDQQQGQAWEQGQQRNQWDQQQGQPWEQGQQRNQWVQQQGQHFKERQGEQRNQWEQQQGQQSGKWGQQLGQQRDQLHGQRLNDKLITPAVNVLNKDNQIIVEVELPGVSYDNVNITLNNNLLVIQGVKQRRTGSQPDESYEIHEAHLGTFHRTLRLPNTVNVDNIIADIQDGLLQVIIKQQRQQKKKQGQRRQQGTAQDSEGISIPIQ